jgi:hypothetical protein
MYERIAPIPVWYCRKTLIRLPSEFRPRLWALLVSRVEPRPCLCADRQTDCLCWWLHSASCERVTVQHMASFSASCLELCWCLLHTSHYLAYFFLILASQRAEQQPVVSEHHWVMTTFFPVLVWCLTPCCLVPSPNVWLQNLAASCSQWYIFFGEIWCFQHVECENYPVLWNMTPRSLVRGGSGLLLTVGTSHGTAECGILYKLSSRNATLFLNPSVFYSC